MATLLLTLFGVLQREAIAAGPPVVSTEAATEVKSSSARIRATVNPDDAQTSFYFKYGQDASYGQQIPLSPKSVGTGTSHISVSRVLDGLSPGTTYHYAVVASNEHGTSEGEDRTFTTASEEEACPNAAIRMAQGSDHLPDCTAWEKVSPDDKNGGHANYRQSLVQAASNGEGVAWASSSSFAGATGAPRVSDYVSRRTDSGWVTQNVAPYGYVDYGQLNTGFRVGFQWFSSDLERGIFSRNDGEGFDRNLYLDDFAGGQLALTPEPLSTPSLAQMLSTDFAVIDTARNGDVVLFEAKQQYTPDAPTASNNAHLYRWEEGTLEFVGILPNGTAATSSLGGRGGSIGSSVLAQAGARVMSEDGSKVFFTVPQGAAVGGNRGRQGEVYMREGGETVHISASQRTDCAGDPTCGGDGIPDPKPDGTNQVLFSTATPDGNFVFLMSCRKLTDDSDASCSNPARSVVYRYEVATGELDAITAGAPSMHAVIDISDDGSVAYIKSNSQDSIYRWADGELEVVGNGDDAGSFDNWSTSVGGMKHSRVTPNGRYLLFVSRASLTGTETNGHVLLYLYDAATDETKCVSCPGDGTPATSAGVTASLQTAAVHSRDYLPRVIDQEQRWVYFGTKQALTADDRNQSWDVYRYDIASGEHVLMSGGTKGDAFLGDTTADGGNVFIVTDQKLTASDRDGQRDLYVVRENGGFPEGQSTPAPCEGDSCQGDATPRPPDMRPGSASYTGAGNAATEGGARNCAGYARLARKTQEQWRRLDRRARRASGKRAKRLRAKAIRASAKAQERRRMARACKRGS